MESNQLRGGVAERARSLACPHCSAGVDRTVVGLFWDCEEGAWRCLLCGHRTFERPRRSQAQIAADRIWEQLFPSSDEDGRGQPQGEEEPEALPPKAA